MARVCDPRHVLFPDYASVFVFKGAPAKGVKACTFCIYAMTSPGTAAEARLVI